MIVKVEKITRLDLARKACSFTLHSQNSTKIGLDKLYGSEHSPMRTQLFVVEMYDIPSFVSTHLVRHNIGIDHFVQTNREDRGASETANRNTPVNHMMLINAQGLINMARKRLCTKASKETQELMRLIIRGVDEVDMFLTPYLVVDCAYRGMCYEPACCGRAQHYYTTG